MATGTFDAVSEFLEFAVESQVEKRARALVAACAARASKNTIDALVGCGLIDRATGRRLALEMWGQMADEREAPVGVLPDDGQEARALEAGDPEPAPAPGEDPAPAPEVEVVVRRGERVCPICDREGVRTVLSPGHPGKETVGCIRHWRQVKREAREAAE